MAYFTRDVKTQYYVMFTRLLNPLLSLRLATVRSLSELCRFARALESCYGVRVLGRVNTRKVEAILSDNVDTSLAILYRRKTMDE